jgi:hypothetical protein
MHGRQLEPTESKNLYNKYMVKYLFISDLEGCEVQGRFNTTPQNTDMCQPEFYEQLKALLDTETDLHVCFLGDYFDQGPYVVQSIIGIAELKQEFPNKVHIILGNRDINKFRLYYERNFEISSN